ncbi:MAG: ATP-binding protein [Armatimonadota bacterium]
MKLTIAITGKGGVGKTTLSSLIIKWLVAHGETPVLAVDADSNANLHEALGVSYDATVGGIREDALHKAKELAGISKQEFMDVRVQEAMVEQDGYDLIVMGRPEGPGCYCFANNVLRDVIRKLSENYRHVVVDNEAGLEHLARRTLLTVDLLCIVTDCSVRGVRTAGNIAKLTDEMGTPVKHRGLIINRVPEGVLPPMVQKEAERTGLPIIAIIPIDQNVSDQDAGGMAVVDIPSDSPARQAIGALLAQYLAE